MEYKILNSDNIAEYIYSIKDLKEYFCDDKLTIEEIGDGNLNFVFIIKGENNKALILKQAVPYLRVLGEDFPLKRERMTYEIRALNEFSKNTPNHIPTIHHASEDMSSVIMEYLDTHIIMRSGLISKIKYPKFSDHISDYLAQNLFKTSSLYLDSVSKRELIDKFNTNSQLCAISEDFLFTFAFMEHPTNDSYADGHPLFEELISNQAFKEQVLNLKYKFMTKNDALLHGDLHTGSIMLNQDETYVIDPEFSFVGPFGFDIGALIGNLTMSYVSHLIQGDREYASWVLNTIDEVLEKFEAKFLALWDAQKSSALITEGFIEENYLNSYKQSFMTDILKDSVGFAGIKITRRMFGAAGVADIRGIEDKDLKDKAMELCLKISTRFVTLHKMIDSRDKIIAIIKDEMK